MNDSTAGRKIVDQLLQDALHAMRISLGLEVAFISEITSGVRIFRYIDAEEDFCPIAVGASDPVEDSYCQRVIDGRIPELIHDARLNAETQSLKATSEIPVGAHLSTPIRCNGEIFGTICCFSRNPSLSLDNHSLELIHLYSNFIGRLLSRAMQDHQLFIKRKSCVQKILNDELFNIVYQPIIHVGMNKLVGHEALTRFTLEPTRPPDQWFNEAAEVGLQIELELAVIRKALTDIHYFPEDTYLSFNISPQTITHGNIDDVFAGASLERIVLEVTEHNSVEDYGTIADRLSTLRRKGMRLAVDDAGAGYASFRHILKLKPDIIKLDASLIAEIDTDMGIRALAAAIVKFAEETGCKVVAEGVETEKELHVLRELNVNKAQGYLLGRPSPLENLNIALTLPFTN